MKFTMASLVLSLYFWRSLADIAYIQKKSYEQPRETASCEIMGDPHVLGFDSRSEGPASLSLGAPTFQIVGSNSEATWSIGFDGNPIYFSAGDVWLVKSDLLLIQGHYIRSTLSKTGGAMMGAIALGGPILDGQVLLVEPRSGTVTLNRRKVAFGVSKREVSSGCVQIVNDEIEHSTVGPFHRVKVNLPMNMEVTVNRYDEFLNVKITMPTTGIGVVDGQCGNMNGNVEDDTRAEIARRMSGSGVLPRDSLFVEH